MNRSMERRTPIANSLIDFVVCIQEKNILEINAPLRNSFKRLHFLHFLFVFVIKETYLGSMLFNRNNQNIIK